MSRAIAALGDIPTLRQALAAVEPVPELPPWNTDRRPLWQRALEARKAAASGSHELVKSQRVEQWQALPKCSARKADGGPCTIPAAPGEKVCWRHGGRRARR